MSTFIKTLRPAKFAMAAYFFLLSFISEAQIYQDIIKNSKTKNFRQLVQQVEDYYIGKDKGRGSGYKQFKRWEEFHRTRLDQHGNLVNVSQVEYRELKNFKTKGRTSGRIAASDFSGNWVSLSAVDHTFENHNGRVNAVLVDPANSHIIYAGAPSGGLWRSIDDGESWECLTDNIASTVGVSAVVIDPTSPVENRTIYILTGDKDALDIGFIGIFKSVDNGASWVNLDFTHGPYDPFSNNARSSDPGNRMGGITPGEHYKLMMHPVDNRMLFFLTSQGIYKSVDAGATWENKIDIDVNDMEFKPGAPATIYVSGKSGTYRSLSTGEKWQKVAPEIPFSSRNELAVTPDHGSTVYLLLGQPEVAALYRSTDSGLNFTKVPTDFDFFDMTRWQYDYDLALAISPTNLNKIYMAGISIHRSSDGGITWEQENMGHADYHFVGIYHNYLYTGNDGGVTRRNLSFTEGSFNYKLEDLSDGFSIAQIYRIGTNSHDPDHVLIGTQDNGTISIKNTFGSALTGADGMECFLDPEQPTTWYSSTQSGWLFRGDDYTIEYPEFPKYTLINPPGTEGDGTWVTPFLMDPGNPGVLFAGFKDLWKNSSRGDAEWINLTRGSVAGSNNRPFNIINLAVAPSNSDFIYFQKGAGEETIYRSRDGGQTWTEHASPATITRIIVHGEDPNVVWVTLGSFSEGARILKSTDGGVSWTDVSGSLPNVPAHCAAYQKNAANRVYVGTDLGVFYKDDNMADWVKFDSGMPYAIITDLEINNATGKIYAGTYGRGAWVSDLVSDPSPGCIASGKITRDLWMNASGTRVSDIPMHLPFSTEELTIFEGPSNAGDDYGSRIRGYICIPTTGDYIFWIASDDRSELWLSTSEDSANKVRIASVNGYTDPRQWSKYTTQQSQPISLQGGQTYYIEALHKEGGGNDHIAVGWELPDGTLERPIAGNRLSPFTPSTNNPPVVSITSPDDGQTFPAGSAINITAEASDSDGSVTKVEFYQGSSKLGEDASAPYEFGWLDVQAGNYVLTAVASDDGGATKTSSAVSISASGDCIALGKITRDLWMNASGTRVSDIPMHLPFSTEELTMFEGPSNASDNYGSRIRGYICVPTTGDYFFWIASDDRSELWLSTGEDPADKVRIASVNGYTNPRQWTKYTSQQSPPISLQADQKYYIEALHKEGGGNDHVAVGWELPDGTQERPIAGNRLSPLTESSFASMIRTEPGFSAEQDKQGIVIFPNPVRQGGFTLALTHFGEVGPPKVANVEIFGVAGLLIHSDQIFCESNCKTLTIHITKEFAPGVYIVNAEVNGRRFSERLLVY